MTSIMKRVIALATAMTVLLLLPLAVSAEAVVTLNVVDNGKDLVVNVQGLEPGTIYSMLLFDAAENPLPFDSEFGIPEMAANTEGVFSDSVTINPTYPDGTVTIQIIEAATEAVAATTTVEVQGDIWVIAAQAAADATAPVTGMPNTGGGGTAGDAQSSSSLSMLVVVAGVLLLAGFTLVAMRVRARGQRA